MMSPPTARWSSTQIAQFYADHSTEIKWDATIYSWSGAFVVPLAIVVAIQMHRRESGNVVSAIVAAASRTIMSISLMLPPLFW
jgi:hypothetical protein